MIGTIVMPVAMIDLNEEGHTYTCLILNDIHFDAARLNLKISDQADELNKFKKEKVILKYSSKFSKDGFGQDFRSH